MPEPAHRSEPPDERRWVTVMFADVAGFTSLSERLDVEEVRDIADRCAEVMGTEVQRYGGTVLRVIGDAVLAVFGAPLSHDNDPERAVRAALAMVAALPGATPAAYDLALHVGINTGDVLAAIQGPAERRDYMVTGDTVNTGSRLEDAALRGEILVGRETYLATQHVIRYDAHEPLAAKGKAEPVEAWLAVEAFEVPRERSATHGPMVGREREMDVLRRVWSTAVENERMHFVTVLGAPGVGKSRLAREFAAAVDTEGGRVLAARCLPFGGSTGLGPFANQVRSAAAIGPASDSDETASRLRSHLEDIFGRPEPELASNLEAMFGSGGQASLPDKEVLFHSARRWVAALARRQPLAMVFEDVHWADATLIELLGSIAARAGEARAVMICLARPELIDNHPEWGAGQSAYTAISLDPLSPQAARLLSEALLAGRPADLIDRLVKTSGGNPLFLEELSAAVGDEQRMDSSNLPTSVRSIISARLDMLAPDEQSLIQDAAVIGELFWRGALEALSGRRIDLELGELEWRGLIKRDNVSAIQGDDQYTFKHALIREVAYGRLPRTVRRARHQSIAAHLERALGDRREEMSAYLARHWDAAGEAERAVNWYTVAGDRAAKAWAKKEAIDLYSRAIELAQAGAMQGQVAGLKVKRARALGALGDNQHAASDIESALPELSGRDRASALLDRARVAFLDVDVESSLRYADQASDAAASLGDSVIEAAVQVVQGAALGMSGRLVPAIEKLSGSLAAWPKEARDSSPEYADGLSNLSLFLYWHGEYDRSIEVGRDAVDRALAVQSLQSSAQGTSHVAMSLVGLGRHIEAMPWFERSIQLGLDWEALPRFSSRTMNMWAGAERELMNFGRARELSEKGLEMARRAKFAPAICSAQIDLFVLDLAEGRYDAAEQALPGVWRAASQVKGIHEWLFQIRVGEAEALLQLAAGHAERGVESARQALAKAEGLGRKKYVSRVSATLALCLLEAGSHPDASGAATRALATAREIGNPNSAWRAADILARARLAAGDDAGATAAHALARQEVMRFAHMLDADRAKLFEAAPEVIAILGAEGITP